MTVAVNVSSVSLVTLSILVLSSAARIALAEEATVVIRPPEDQGFYPNLIVIETGDTVIWHNLDTTIHTVTSGTNGTPDGKFDSSPNDVTFIAPGSTFNYTFTAAGEFPYYCVLHPFEVGTVIVNVKPTQTPITITLSTVEKSYNMTVNSATSEATEATFSPYQSLSVTFDKPGEIQLTLPKNLIEDIGVVGDIRHDQVWAEGQSNDNIDFTQTEGPDTITISFTLQEDNVTLVIIPEFPVVAALLVVVIGGIVAYTRLAKNRNPIWQ